MTVSRARSSGRAAVPVEQDAAPAVHHLPVPDPRLLDLPAVPESALPRALLEQLPATTPPAPWDCRVRAVVWVQRGTVRLPAGSSHAALPLTLGAVVEYLDSPVGPYREVFAGPLVRAGARPAVTVPFIAVDSLPSVHGGRAHWGLPKAFGHFGGDLDDVAVTGDGWSVGVRARSVGPPVPLVASFANVQSAGRATVRVRGRGRAARVRVDAVGPTLSDWLGAGTHAGVVGCGRLVVGRAE